MLCHASARSLYTLLSKSAVVISLIYALLQFPVDCCEVYRAVGVFLIVVEVIVVRVLCCHWCRVAGTAVVCDRTGSSSRLPVDRHDHVRGEVALSPVRGDERVR